MVSDRKATVLLSDLHAHLVEALAGGRAQPGGGWSVPHLQMGIRSGPERRGIGHVSLHVRVCMRARIYLVVPTQSHCEVNRQVKSHACDRPRFVRGYSGNGHECEDCDGNAAKCAALKALNKEIHVSAERRNKKG